jgi:hypothetical protein
MIDTIWLLLKNPPCTYIVYFPKKLFIRFIVQTQRRVLNINRKEYEMTVQDELNKKKKLLESELKRYEVALKHQKNLLTDEIKDFKNKVKVKVEDSSEILNKAKYIAIALGALWVIYKMISVFFGESEDVAVQRVSDEKPDSSVVMVQKEESGIVKKIKEGIATFILSLAKKELSKAIDRFTKDFKERNVY